MMRPPRQQLLAYQSTEELRRKEEKRQKKIDDPTVVKMIPAARYIIYYATIITFGEFLLHVGDSSARDVTFAWQNFAFCAFTWPYYILTIAGKTVDVTVEEAGGWYKLLKEIGFTYGALMVSQTIIALLLKFELISITNIEIFLFHISAGICEEIAFRLLPITLMKMATAQVLIERRDKKLKGLKPGLTVQYYVPMLITVFITAIIFMFMHTSVYGRVPLLMISTFLAGLILGTSFYVTGSIFATIFAHVLNNAVTAGVVVRNSMLTGDTVTQVLIIIIIMVLFLAFIVAFRRERGKHHEKKQATSTVKEKTSKEKKPVTTRDVLLMMIGGVAFSLVVYWPLHAFSTDTIDNFLINEIEEGLPGIDTINVLIIFYSIIVFGTFAITSFIVSDRRVSWKKLVAVNIAAIVITLLYMWGMSGSTFHLYYPWIQPYPRYVNAAYLAYVLVNPAMYFSIQLIAHVIFMTLLAWGLLA